MQHTVTGNTVHSQFLAVRFAPLGTLRRTNGRGVVPTTDMAAVLSRLSCDGLKLLAISTTGSHRSREAPKADIELLGLKCREVPNADIGSGPLSITLSAHGIFDC